MPGFDPDELVVAGSGHVYVGDDTATFPDDIDTVLDWATTPDAGWVDLGYTTEDGPRFTFDRTTVDIKAWQSFDPLRTIVTEVPKQVEFDLHQWNADSLRLGLGGGTISATANGFMLEPPDASVVDVRKLVIVGSDGDKNYAFCYRRTTNGKAFNFGFQRADSASLAIGMKVLAADEGEQPFRLLTDDPAFNDIGS